MRQPSQAVLPKLSCGDVTVTQIDSKGYGHATVTIPATDCQSQWLEFQAKPQEQPVTFGDVAMTPGA
jgi:hypothetical protein